MGGNYLGKRSSIPEAKRKRNGNKVHKNREFITMSEESALPSAQVSEKKGKTSPQKYRNAWRANIPIPPKTPKTKPSIPKNP